MADGAKGYDDVMAAVSAHLAQRQRHVEALHEERRGLMKRIAEVDATLTMLGAWQAKKRGRSPSNVRAWEQEGANRATKSELVLAYLRTNPGAIMPEVRKATGCARNFLNWLEGRGRVRSVGEKNSTQRWYAANEVPAQAGGQGE